MSEEQPPQRPDLANLLWENQGRPEDHASATWLEEEEMRLKALRSQPSQVEESEVRSRGLGPLDESAAEGSLHPAVGTSRQPRSTSSTSAALGATLLILTLCSVVLAVLGLNQLRK